MRTDPVNHHDARQLIAEAELGRLPLVVRRCSVGLRDELAEARTEVATRVLFSVSISPKRTLRWPWRTTLVRRGSGRLDILVRLALGRVARGRPARSHEDPPDDPNEWLGAGGWAPVLRPGGLARGGLLGLQPP